MEADEVRAQVIALEKALAEKKAKPVERDAGELADALARSRKGTGAYPQAGAIAAAVVLGTGNPKPEATALSSEEGAFAAQASSDSEPVPAKSPDAVSSETEVSGGSSLASAEPATDEERELAVHNALAIAFKQVTERSRASMLTTPEIWEDTGIIPSFMSAEDFEMLVFDYLEDYAEEHGRSADGIAPEALTSASAADPSQSSLAQETVRSHVHSSYSSSSCRSVGVPAFKRQAQSPEGSHGADSAESEKTAKTATVPTAVHGATVAAFAPDATENADASAENRDGNSNAGAVAAEETFAATGIEQPEEEKPAFDPDNPFANATVPAGYKIELLEGEWVLVEDPDAEPVELEIQCDTIRRLIGHYTYYLYDSALMTDAYARWAFLSGEDDPLITFAICVRDESRIYPRPMDARSLANPPFNLEADVLEELWKSSRTDAAYEDLERVEASNGDVYFYSTAFLEPALAQSLAEWESVGRVINV